jgi:hypothetical protein
VVTFYLSLTLPLVFIYGLALLDILEIPFKTYLQLGRWQTSITPADGMLRQKD